MHLAIVGGVERSESEFQRVARLAGHTVELHGGHMFGRGGESLQSAIVRADVVIIITDINSHGAVLEARKIARKHDVPTLIVKRLGVSRFLKLLEDLQAEIRELRRAPSLAALRHAG